MALFAACLAFSALMTTPEVKSFLPSWFTLPQFVWALLFGVLLRNFLTSAFKVNMFDRAIDVFGKRLAQHLPGHCAAQPQAVATA